MPKLRNSKTVKIQPAPELFVLIDEHADVVCTQHKMRDAVTDRAQFRDAGVSGVRIFKYSPGEEIK